jgi:hypothetical protein
MINVTYEAFNAIRSASLGPVVGARERSDSTWDISLSEDTLERLERHRCPGESYSDVIIRLAHYAAGKVH